MTVRAMDTRARLKGVHTLGLGADHSMPRPLMHLLSRGGKFIVTPRMPLEQRSKANAQAFSDYKRSVRLRIMFSSKPQNQFDPRYHVPNPTWQPRPASRVVEQQLERLGEALECMHARPARQVSNCSLEERAALQTLARDHDIIVKPADKNLGLTLIARPWYIAECERQLGDAAIYQKAYGVPLEACQNRVIRFIKAMPQEVLPPNERKWLLAETKRRMQLPQFYVMPKLHKDPPKGRPIVASHSWCTWPLSRWLADKLNSHAAAQETVLTDTNALIARLQHLRLEEDAHVVLSTADVESLYTSIPVQAAVQAVRERLLDRGVDVTCVSTIVEALELVLSLNFFEFNGSSFHQVQGLAMGTPCAPPVANLFLASLETALPKPLLYLRFLDDILTVQVVDETHPESTLWDCMHAMHPSIRLTRVRSERAVDFLDLQIYRQGSMLLHRVHQKVLNKYLYISPRSCHPLHVIKGFVRTELIRYARNSSTELDFVRICHAFSNRLRERGFHPCFLRHAFASVAFEHHAIRGDRQVPMVFKSLFTGRESSELLRCTLREWYDSTPEGFKLLVQKPTLCHTNGKNIYCTLVRAKVPT